MTDLVARLRVSASAEGGDKIRAIAREVAQLGSGAGEAAPEFERLAGDLRDLAQQQALIDQFGKLKRETIGLGEAQQAAQAGVNAAARALRDKQAALTAATGAERAASSALDAARAKHNDLKIAVTAAANELKFLKARAKESGDATGAYAAQIEAAKTRLAGLKEQSAAAGAGTRALAADYKPVAAALKDAGAAAGTAEREFERTRAEAGRSKTAFQQKTLALHETRKAMQDVGVSSGDLAGAQTKLSAAVQKVSAAVQDVSVKVRTVNPVLATLGTSAELAQAALGRIGVRSAAQIHTDIARINADLQLLAGNANISQSEFDRAFAAGRARVAELRRELSGAGSAMDQVKERSDGLVTKLKGLAGAFLGIQTAAKFVEANTELEQLRRGLTAVTGDAGLAEEELQRLRATADRLGVAVGPLAQAWISLAASTRGTVLEGRATREVFDAVVGSMSRLGASSARTEQALQAVSQMASKGVISMEELRQQLGEALPGAMDAATSGLGVTKQQLIALVESGGLLAEDFLPALARGLKETFGDGEQSVDGFAASWQRLKNTFSGTAQALGDLGFMSALATAADGASVAVQHIAAAFVLVGKQIGITAAAIATFDLSSPIASIRAWWQALGEAEAEVKARLDGVGKAADDAATRTASAGSAAQRAGTAAASAAVGFDAAGSAMQSAAGAAASATTGMDGATTAVAASADAAGAASAGWVGLNAAFAQATTGAEGYTQQALKQAEVVKAQGEVSVRLAQLTGDEARALEARAAASDANVAAANRIVSARNAEVKVLASQLVALELEGKRMGGLTDAKSAQVDAIKKLIEQKTLEARKSEEVAKLLSAEAKAANDAAYSIENAYKGLGLRSAAEIKRLTDTAIGNFNRIRDSGTASSETVKDAFIAAARQIISANGGVATSWVRAQAAVYGLKVEASATGDTIVEVFGRAGDSIRGLREDAEYGAGGFEKLRGTVEQTISSLERLRELQQIVNPPGGGGGVQGLPDGLSPQQLDGLNLTQREKEDYYLNRKPDGSGTVNRYVTTATASESFKRQQAYGVYGLKDQAQVDEFVARYGDAISKGWAQAAVGMDPNLTAQESSRRIAAGANAAVKELADEIKKEARANAGSVRRLAGSAGAAAAGAAAAPASTTHTVTLNLNGRSTTINAASASDATTLTTWLRQLESAARTAS